MDRRIITFNGRKYSSKKSGNQVYHIATTDPRTRLSRDMWEYYKQEKLSLHDIIHHINGNTLDDRIENFSKVFWNIHSHNHLIGIKRSKETRKKISQVKSKPNPIRSLNILGENNPNWKGGKSLTYKYNLYRKVGL